jgi:drug/metabolite transporter (DMT)-like permease/uncharacterized protein YjiS (DUF1127 family)
MDKRPRESFQEGSSLSNSKTAAALGAGVIAITLFALTPTTTRLAIVQVEGLDIGLSRTLGASMIAILLILLLRIPPPRRPAEWQGLGLFSLGCFILFPLLFSIGTQSTSAAHASLIMACMPVVTSAFGFVLDRHLPGAAWLAGAALALLGEIVLIVAAKGMPSVQPTIGGDLIVLISCVSFSLGAVAGSRTAARIGAWRATFWAIGVASIALLPVAVAQSATLSIGTLAPITWLALLHLSVGATLIACIAWPFALEQGGISRIAPLQFLQPVLALVFAAVVLGEGLGTVTLSCGVAILLGLVITWRNAPTTARAPAASVGEGGARAVWSLARSFRDLIERRRARRELFTMGYSQIKDLGFPPELGVGEGRARWRRD